MKIQRRNKSHVATGKPRGGRRPGAGKKLPPSVTNFRDEWRTYFESVEGRDFLRKRAKKSNQILAVLLRLVFPAPIAVSGDGAGSPVPVRVVVDDRLGVKP